jgi:hypothetical protein
MEKGRGYYGQIKMDDNAGVDFSSLWGYFNASVRTFSS